MRSHYKIKYTDGRHHRSRWPAKYCVREPVGLSTTLKYLSILLLVSTTHIAIAAESALFQDLPGDIEEPLDAALDLDREPDEEMIVTAPKPDRGQVPQFEYLLETYKARSKGSLLYRRGKFAESFPYLLVAAKRGFRLAQARVGFLFQQGIGTPRNAEAAIAWLALAATPDTLPEIMNYYRAQWAKIPPEYIPRLEQVIDEYREQYGNRENRVVCDMSRKAGTHFKKLTCRFMDESIYQDFSDSINADEAIEQIGGAG